jgi:hypothetical protein
MWNLISGNTNMNKFERLMNHKGHLERLAQSKKTINTKKPKTPSFFAKKKINAGLRLERALKILYENKVLFGKMYDIHNKMSPYSAKINLPSKCPAFVSLPNQKNREKVVISNENKKLFNRLAYAKSSYNILRLANDYKYNQYLENNISKNNNRTNPNLNYITYENFNKRIRSKSFIDKTKKKLYNCKKNSLKGHIGQNSCKTLFYNYYDDMAKTYENNNNSNGINYEISNGNNKKRLKLRRPNSCRNYIFGKNIQIQENSNILSCDTGYSVSHSNYKNKPNSSKTRTNISYSTKAITSV